MPSFWEVAFKHLKERARISQAGRKKTSLESQATLRPGRTVFYTAALLTWPNPDSVHEILMRFL